MQRKTQNKKKDINNKKNNKKLLPTTSMDLKYKIKY